MLKLPSRWKNCPKYGAVVANIFLPFKVPLDENYNSLLPANTYFTPNMLINYSKQKKISIGLWIDLTNTDRFYDKNIVESNNISYVKIKCKGHGECPSEAQTNLFIEICSKFITKNPNKIIAVHCTHGFNRTGFLISAFLVRHEDWSIDAAITCFAQSRPPGIYKQDYLDQLCQIYVHDSYIQAPPLPDWCNENNSLNDDVVENTNSVPSSCHFLEEIDNISLIRDQNRVNCLQSICSEMCHFNLEGFPGCQPVSMTQNNINMIKEKDYMVSWKADGNRYMMLILNADDMFFIDRNFNIYQVFNLTFLRRNSKDKLQNTLLDGEMVVDVVNDQRYPRYLIYDIVYCDGKDVSRCNFRERINIIFKQVIQPREIAKRMGQIDRNKEPIGVRIKDFFELKNTYKFFETKFQNSLSHEIDGLIFQPVDLEYISGRCSEVLKWKPPSHNSVDFLLTIVEEKRPGRIEKYIGQLYVGGQMHQFAQIHVTNELKKYHNRIIECRYNFSKNAWEFMRERTDKKYPNSIRTATNVVNSIKYPITKDFLLDYIAQKSY